MPLGSIVTDLVRPEPRQWSPEDVLALIDWLPEESASAALAAGGREFYGWSTDRWLFKYVFDAIRVLTTTTARIHAGKKARQIPDPKPFPDPHELATQTRVARPAAVSVGDLGALNN